MKPTHVHVMKKVIRVTLTLVIFYMGFSIFAHFYADIAAFHPPEPSYTTHAPIMFLPVTGTDKIAVYVQTTSYARTTVIFAHGNAEDCGHNEYFFSQYATHGFNIYGVEYRGYGLSDGKASLQNAIDDVETVYMYLTQEKNVPAENIILHGRSLGTACVLDVAARHPVGGVILESAFLSVFRVVTQIPFLLFDRMKNSEKIAQIDAPLLYMHGEKDRIIPVWHGKKLYALAQEPKQAYWVTDAGHNNVLFSDEAKYWEKIHVFTQTLPHSGNMADTMNAADNNR